MYTQIEEGAKKELSYILSPDYIKDRFGGDVKKACEEHPSIYAYYLLDVKLRWYQLYMLEKMLQYKYVLGIWGRRLGKSTTFKIFCSWALRFNKFPQGIEKTTKIIVIAHTQDGAESYIDEIRMMYKAGDLVVNRRFRGALGTKFFTSNLPERMSGVKNNMKQLGVYNNGWNTIKAYPPTTAARGLPASIMILDELAFWCDYTSLQKDDYTIYNEVVRPIPTDQPDSMIFGATTPNGNSGLAYDLMRVDGHKTRYELVWFPYFYRDNPDYLQEMSLVEQEYKDSGRHNEFRQEYLAELVSKDKAYFDKDTEVNPVFDNNSGMITGNKTLDPIHMGIDFGGSAKSRTVITLSYKDRDNHIHRIYHKRYPLREDSDLQSDIINLSMRFNIIKYHVDSQGGGSAFYAWFRRKFGKNMIDEVSFKSEKVDMYRLFKIACYKGRIHSYYDRELMEEFYGFTADLKPSKSTTDDMLDSFVVSCKDWLVEKQNSAYTVIKW